MRQLAGVLFFTATQLQQHLHRLLPVHPGLRHPQQVFLTMLGMLTDFLVYYCSL